MRGDSGEITQADLIRAMGFSRQTAAEWARRPGCPRVQRKGKWYYRWPDFREWYIAERIAAGVSQGRPTDFEDAKKRKLAAEAEMAELLLAKARAEVVPVEDFRAALLGAFGRVRTRLRDFPARAAQLVKGKRTPAQMRAALEKLVEEVLAELRNEDLDDDEGLEGAA